MKYKICAHLGLQRGEIFPENYGNFPKVSKNSRIFQKVYKKYREVSKISGKFWKFSGFFFLPVCLVLIRRKKLLKRLNPRFDNNIA